MNQPPTFLDEPVKIARSTTSGKLLRDLEALYCVEIIGLSNGIRARYWMTQIEVETHIKGGFAAIRELQQKWLKQKAA
ncbi:MAG: hypothetical protein KME42_13800 [Tildeniella nuda ZEHNDER 1965/U140]|jgi:hypothetical protein|nr:hypothetical protein [Tildeniella nuda ZEHNDER 1965/U140]